jgi:hypothetical protein
MGLSRKTREEILQELEDQRLHSEYPDYVSEMYGGFYTMIPDDEEEE